MRKAKVLLASILVTSVAHGAWIFPLLPTERDRFINCVNSLTKH
ncbi:MAG: hypothetical protein ACP5UF_08115 [Hydrogenobaculum sp.]